MARRSVPSFSLIALADRHRADQPRAGPHSVWVFPMRPRDDDDLPRTKGPSIPTLPLPGRPFRHRNRLFVRTRLSLVPPFLPPLPPCRFNPSVAVMGHWFRRHRATAIGIVVSGGAVGGIVFPILLQHLIPVIGFGWTVRIIGFVIMACFVVACLTIKTRLPLSGRVSWRTAIDLHGFKDPRYVLATVAGFLYVLYDRGLILLADRPSSTGYRTRTLYRTFISRFTLPSAVSRPPSPTTCLSS